MRYGRLRVTTPDGQVREHGLDVPAVTLGRSPENAVVIEDISVSRRHARVTIESGMPLIEDLGSENGIYVGGQRLAPGQRHMFANAVVRVGAVEVSYLPAESSPPNPGGAPAAGAVPAAAAAAAAGGASAQPIVVVLRGPSAPVSAGGMATATVSVQNRGATVDELSISVVDLPEGWADVNKPIVPLLPGARDEITIMLRPPRAASTVAGDHAFSVAVASRNNGVEIRAVGVVTVEAFQGLTAALQPVRSDGNFTVSLENTGNAPLPLALSAQDEEARLQFSFDALNVELPPGGRKAVKLRAKMSGAPKFGREIVKPFTVEARQQGAGGQRASAAGQLRVKPSLEAWKLPVLALLALSGLTVGGLTYARQCEPWGLPGCRDSGATVPAGRTGETPTAAGQTVGGQTPGQGGLPATPSGGTTPPPGASVTTTTGQSTTPPPAATTAVPSVTTSPGVTTSPVVTTTPTLKFPEADRVLDPTKDYVAIVATTAGDFTIDLDVIDAFDTSNSFAFLAKKGFYDGMHFASQRVAVVVGNDDGTGDPGYTQAADFTNVKNTAGTVGMIPTAKDPERIGSDWFINLQANTVFDTGGFAGDVRPIFGLVITGAEIVAQLKSEDVIKGIKIEERTFRPLPFPTLVRPFPTIRPITLP